MGKKETIGLKIAILFSLVVISCILLLPKERNVENSKKQDSEQEILDRTETEEKYDETEITINGVLETEKEVEGENVDMGKDKDEQIKSENAEIKNDEGEKLEGEKLKNENAKGENVENEKFESEKIEIENPANHLDVSTWEPTSDETIISPYQQMVIDAGYGVVVDFGDQSYAVLMKGPKERIGELSGDAILVEYLAEKGLYASNRTGGWIDMEREWYMYIAYDAYEIETSENDWSGNGSYEFADE